MSEPLSERAQRIWLRLELGHINPDKVALAAYLGDADARSAMKGIAEKNNSEGPSEPNEDFGRWLAGLVAYGQPVVLRACLAYSRTALLQWKHMRHDLRHDGVAAMNFILAYQLVMAAEDIALHDSLKHRETMEECLKAAESSPADLLHTNQLPRHALFMALFLHTGQATTDRWQQAFSEIRVNLACFWPKERTRRSIVRHHLVSWAIDEYEQSDPLAKHPTQPPDCGVAD